MLNKKALFLVQFLLAFAIVFCVFGCANQQRPQGGPRDVTPPVLLKSTPPNMARHFAAKTIQLDFDEYFKLTNQYQEITISPAQDKQPEFKIKQKSLIINFKDTLQKNTTYVINFGKAIQDVNESNTVKNFTYVFSTGEHIDSLSISGSVTNTLTQQKEKDITVMLFPIEKDTLFGKKKPSIYTSTDTAGNFSLNNLHDGTYRIYALKETAPNKIFDNDDELIAFQKNPIKLYKDTTDIQLTLFKQVPEKFRVKEKKFDVDGKMFFVFNKRLFNPSIKIIYPPALDAQKLAEFVPTKDTAYLYSKNMDFDSIRVAFFDGKKALDSVSLRKGRKETFQKGFLFGLNVGQNKLKPTNNLIIMPTLPADSFDPLLVNLYEDSVAVNNLNFKKDTSAVRKYEIAYHWNPAARYVLVIDAGAFTDIYGDKNKKFSRPFQVDKEENYGTLILKVTIPDTSKAYVVELFQNEKNILNSYPINKNTTITYKNYATGKYRIRVVYDQNKNGRWDSGNVKQRLQPENIWLNQQEFLIIPNYEATKDLTIPKEQTTE